jgi:hypothetical protein
MKKVELTDWFHGQSGWTYCKTVSQHKTIYGIRCEQTKSLWFEAANLDAAILKMYVNLKK